MKLYQAVLSLVSVLILPGCAAVTEPFGLEDPFAIERPFEGFARNEAMLSPSFDLATIIIEAPKGLNGTFAATLRDRIIGVLQARDIPALSETRMRAWVLKGRAANVMSSEAGDSRRRIVVWRLFDPDRVPKGQFSTIFQGENAATVEPRLSVLAEQIADKIGPLSHPQQVPSETAKVVADNPIFWIGAIKGAPGDGNAALAQALQSALPLQGMRVASVQANAAWHVECAVAIQVKSASEEIVVLRWRLLDKAGKEVGILTQENPVPRGRLNKPWREIAGFAGEAAAAGFRKIVQQVTRGKAS